VDKGRRLHKFVFMDVGQVPRNLGATLGDGAGIRLETARRKASGAAGWIE